MTQSPQILAETFGLDEIPAIVSHCNIAPTQDVAAVRLAESGNKRQLTFLRWGLIPNWADDPSIGNKMINARSESAARNPVFRDAYARRRCLIPADGFYEWEKSGKARVPYYYQLKEHALFAIAGLWDRWTHPAGVIESFTILTTGANELVARVHDRMPVIVTPEHFGLWLDPMLDPAAVGELFEPFPSGAMQCHRVSDRVNKPDEDDPGLVMPVENPEPKFL